MVNSGSERDNRAYYDVFSKQYERSRGENAPGGYHELLDELEADIVARYGTGRDVLEVGCGTGLVLSRIARFAKKAVGVDLSPGMLEKAKARGLTVAEGSATELPFEDESFDVACSFKVLPHVAGIERALAEMARVVRPGGHVLAEFYNPHSLRGLIKRFGPKGKVGDDTTEGDVYLRFDTPADVARWVPDDCRLVASRGIRIVVPLGAMMRVPVLGSLMRKAEWALCDTPLARFGGFWVAVLEKHR